MGGNGVEVVTFNGIKWLNEKNVETGLGHSNLTMITGKYCKDRRKERQELQNCNCQPRRIFIREDLGIQVIMDCRTIQVVKFREKLGFIQYDPIMTQEKSVLTKLDTFIKTEDKLFQHSVLG